MRMRRESADLGLPGPVRVRKSAAHTDAFVKHDKPSQSPEQSRVPALVEILLEGALRWAVHPREWLHPRECAQRASARRLSPCAALIRSLAQHGCAHEVYQWQMPCTSFRLRYSLGKETEHRNA